MISLASPITWLLVTTMPDGSMMKPEPSEFERRCCARRRVVAALCPALAAPVEELLEEIVEGRSGRQLRQLPGCALSTVVAAEMLTTASIT